MSRYRPYIGYTSHLARSQSDGQLIKETGMNLPPTFDPRYPGGPSPDYMAARKHAEEIFDDKMEIEYYKHQEKLQADFELRMMREEQERALKRMKWDDELLDSKFNKF